MTRVIFEYSEKSGKWVPLVEGETTPKGASQAFAAVVLTAQMLDPALLIRSKVVTVDATTYRIVPAVQSGSEAADSADRIVDY